MKRRIDWKKQVNILADYCEDRIIKENEIVVSMLDKIIDENNPCQLVVIKNQLSGIKAMLQLTDNRALYAIKNARKGKEDII